MTQYTAAHVVHLLCGISFIGVVFFEVLILEGMRAPLGPQRMAEVERALVARARRIMPWVVATLFLSGIAMATTWWPSLRETDSRFAVLLWIKIALAFSVLGHFVFALSRAATGCMNSTLFRRLHVSVAIHMLGIVLMAKLMFVPG